MFIVIAGLLALVSGAGAPSALSVYDGSCQDEMGIVRFEIDGMGVYATDYQLERFDSIRGFDDADLWPVGDTQGRPQWLRLALETGNFEMHDGEVVQCVKLGLDPLKSIRVRGHAVRSG